MKVIITKPAKKHLRTLIDFYLGYIPQNKVIQIIDSVIAKTKSLSHIGSAGSIEQNLTSHHFTYRYILQGNCKIIYRIEDNTIFVTDFFDVRQDPSTLIDRQH